MPIREFRCPACRRVKEVIHPSLDPEKVPPPDCHGTMELLISLPRLDTSSTFKPFTWRGPTGMYHEINTLHDLRGVEHAYQSTGHNVRFDAYSAEPSNPDPIDGFGLPYRSGEEGEAPSTITVDMGKNSD